MAEFKNSLILDVTPFLNGVKKAVGATKDLEQDTKVVIEADVSGVEQGVKKAAGAFDKLQSEAKAAEDRVSELNAELRDVAAAGKGSSKEFAKLKKELAEAEKNAAKLQDNVKKVELQAKGGLKGAFKEAGGAIAGGDFGGALTGLASSIPVPQIAAAGVAIGAVASVVGSAVEKAKEFSVAQKEVALQTGLSGEALKELESAAKNAYIQGVGESAADALKVVGALRQTLGDSVPVDELDKVAARANQVGKSLGVETPELVSKLSPVIKQFGGDFNQVLNLVAAGAQKGVADVGGYLDAINEFSVNAKEAGFSVEEFTTGLTIAGEAGVKDFAKVGDGIKEIENRIKSGDLVAQFAAVGGEIGANLQQIAQAGRDGTLSGKEVLQNSIAEIEEAFKSGQISEAFRGQLLTQLGGSIAEDVGSNVFTKMFSKENLNPAAIKASADAAGKQINDNLANQDPFAALSKKADIFLQSFGEPIFKAFNEIASIISEIFGGTEDAGDGIAEFGRLAGEALASLTTNVKSFLETILEIKNAASDVGDFIGDLFGGDSAAEDAKKATEAAKKVAEQSKKNKQQLVADAKEIAKSGKLSEDQIKALAEKYKISTDEAKQLVGASAEIGATLKQAALEVNNLSQRFQAASAAAGSNLQVNRDAIAQLEVDIAKARKEGDTATVKQLQDRIKEIKAEALNANRSVRELERAADSSAFATDPAAQKAAAAARNASLLETKKRQDIINAQTIAGARKRERAILEIESKAAVESLKVQRSGIDTNTVAGRQAVAELNREIERVEKDFADRRRALYAAEQADRVNILKSREAAILAAVNDTNGAIVEGAQQQIEFGNVTAANLQSLLSANQRLVADSTRAAVRAIVEATPEFADAMLAIDDQLAQGFLSGEDYQAKVAALRDSLTSTFRSNGEFGDEIGKQIEAAFERGNRSVADFTRQTNASIRDTQVANLFSGFVRGVEESVVALERQRDTLLLNKDITEETRDILGKQFAAAIDKARRPFKGLLDSAVATGDALRDIQFNLEADEAADQAAEVAKQVDEITKAFERGEITYQSAIDQLSGLGEVAEIDFLDRLGANLTTAVSAIAEAQRAAVAQTLANINQLVSDRTALEELQNTVGLTEEQEKQLADVNTQIVDGQQAAQEQIISQGAATLAESLANGENIGESLKKMAAEQAASLVDLYVAPLIAQYLAVLGPFALPAALAASALIKGILNSAINSFETGGRIKGGEQLIRVNERGEEFVSKASVTSKYGPFLEALNKTGSLDKALGYAPSRPTMIPVQAPVSQVSMSAMASELAMIRERLETMQAMAPFDGSLTVTLDSKLQARDARRAMIRKAR